MHTYNVYLFYDNSDEIIYVGKTKRPIEERMKEHFGPYGHLSKNVINNVKYIKYYKFLTENDMNIAEAYLIKKYKNSCHNKKREYISREDIDYIKNKIDNQKLIDYGGKRQKCHSRKEQENLQQKIMKIVNLIYLKLKNIFNDLIYKI